MSKGFTFTDSTFTVTDATTSIGVSTSKIHEVLQRITYKSGWKLSIDAQNFGFSRLKIEVRTTDSRDVHDKNFLAAHLFPIPNGADFGWADDAIEDWIFECINLVERHEAGEFFRVDGVRPFMPEHGFGSNPYNVRRRAHPVP